MQVLDHLLPQPAFDLTAEKQAAFESLVDAPREVLIDYQLSYNSHGWVQSMIFVSHGKKLIEDGG